jgi:hypothetical protein
LEDTKLPESLKIRFVELVIVGVPAVGNEIPNVGLESAPIGVLLRSVITSLRTVEAPVWSVAALTDFTPVGIKPSMATRQKAATPIAMTTSISEKPEI